MTMITKRLLAACGILALSSLTGVTARAAAKAAHGFWDITELTFTKGANEGIQRGVAWGDPARGEYGLIVKNRSGVTSGWHTHPNALHVVAISGTLVAEVEGSPPREVGAGSGFVETPKVKYRVTCKEGADCMFLLTGSKKYVYVPAKEP